MQGRFVVIFEMRRNQTIALEGVAHLGGLAAQRADPIRIRGLSHCLGRAFVINDEGRRRKDKVARRMIGMDFGINYHANRKCGQLPDRRLHLPGIGRSLARVYNDHALFGKNDAGIRIHLPRRLHVDPFLDFPKMRAKVLCPHRRAGKRDVDHQNKDSCSSERHNSSWLNCADRIKISQRRIGSLSPEFGLPVFTSNIRPPSSGVKKNNGKRARSGAHAEI